MQAHVERFIRTLRNEVLDQEKQADQQTADGHTRPTAFLVTLAHGWIVTIHLGRGPRHGLGGFGAGAEELGKSEHVEFEICRAVFQPLDLVR